MRSLPSIALILMTVVLALQPGGVAASAVPQSRVQINLSFAPLVRQAAPAVVNIYAQRTVKARAVGQLFADPMFQQFFQGTLPKGFTRQRLENALGSGVIVASDGLIVTSNHVIAGADQIRVVLGDRREFDATVVIADEHADLALLRINAKGQALPYLELKDSDEAEVGDLVLAIGNPFGVGQTVTSGIISAMAHGAVGSSDLDYYIQTDAAINPGNSGGALISMDGKLLGINAAIYSQSGGNLGIGFAVPSNMVRAILLAVQQGKKTIVRPWLGLEGQDVTPDLAASLNMPQPRGVLVNRLSAASPATKAGMKVGDVIVSVQGREIVDPDDFKYRIATMAVGASADFGVLRKGQRLDFQVALMPPPEDPPRDKMTVAGRSPFTGTVVENLSPAVLDELGPHGMEHGVVIVDVREDSSAASIGLQPGDVILDVNKTPIGAVKDLKAVLEQHPPGTGWRLSVQRGDSTLQIMVGG